MEMTFTIPGEPQGKARHRAFLDKKKERLIFKTPDKTVDYEQLVALCFLGTRGRFIFTGQQPIRADILAYYRIPNKTSKVNRQLMLTDKIRPTKKPDIDNITKIIYDGLNGVAWHDDAQIVEGNTSKHYAEEPRVVVTLSTLINTD